jgi:hypothetical protein
MMRSKKRRINSESELMGAGPSCGMIYSSKSNVQFMEEVDYKMEDTSDME